MLRIARTSPIPFFLALLGMLLLFAAPAAASPLAGTYSIGPTGNYASITAAVADVKAQGMRGPVILELQPAYLSTVETFPLTFSALGTTAVNTLTLRPQSGATALSITSANTTAATVDLNGAQFLIIDGRPGGIGSNAGSGGGAASQLTIANTSTSGVALRFINEASGNTVQYTTLTGVNISATSGTVVFSTTTGANGNDNNTIDHCDIRDGASTPANGIYALGTTTTTAANNSGDTVSNCNIFNFYAATAVNSAGVRLDGGNNGWTITGNSFYQTVSRASVSASVRAIYINFAVGNGSTVNGNSIGGSAPGAGGSAWTVTGTGNAYLFAGIHLNVGTLLTPSNVQGNTVANIVWTSSSSATALPGVWSGIHVQAGSVNIGTITGNTVGSGTGTGSVSVTTSGDGGTSFGISSPGTDAATIANNTVGSITVNGTSTGVSASLIGIDVAGGKDTISNNLVGSTTTVNSLNAATSSTSGTGQQVTGILDNGSSSNSITGNTVVNLNNNYVGTATTGQIRGIVSQASTNTITGNTVRNLSTTSQNAGTTRFASVLGISQSTATPGQTLSQNTVHSLANMAASAAVTVTGIYYNGIGNGTNVIARNLVHSLAVSSISTSSVVNGMQFVSGTFTVQNNMVRAGLDATGAGTAGASTVRGIYDDTGPGNGRNFYHNSVYLGGTQTSGTGATTFAFQHTDAYADNHTIQNNLFVNARGNSGGTGRHYAVAYGGVTTFYLTAGGNIFLASGTGGVLGTFNGSDCTTLSAWQLTTGRDATSAVGYPLFVNPTGTAATVDLHLQASNPAEGQGIPIAAVTDDFDGQTRSTLTPVDVGADAGNFTFSSDIFAPFISYTPLSDTLSLASRAVTGFATITDNVGVAGAANVPRLYFKKSTDADAFGVANDSSGNGWKYVTATGSSPYGFTLDYSLLNGGGVANGDTIQYFVVAQDEANNPISSPLGAASFANPPVQNVIGKPGSVNSYRVGDITAPAISYPLLTSGSTASRVLTAWATITDNVGVASGANAPRLYFKKSTDADVFGVANNSTGNGWKYATATGSGPYGFTLDYSLINGGSVTAGDTIQYFVVAQDAANNFRSSPAGATASANPPVQNVNGHGAVNSFSILPIFGGGAVTVGTGGTYPSLSGVGGLFAALNGAVLTGNVVVNITSDLTETGGVALKKFNSNEYPPTRTLTIQPDSATMRTISGNAISSLSLITLDGADRVTIDGRFGGSGRYLTFRNTSIGGVGSTIYFNHDACSNTVRNCVVEGATLSGALGVIGFGAGTVTGNSNNLITGCQVRDLSNAVGVPEILIGSAGATAAANSGNTIANNELFNFKSNGICIGSVGNDSWTLSGNNIFEANASNNFLLFGIYMQGGGTNVITGNFIHDLVNTGTFSYGIVFGGTGTTTIARNRITALNVNAATTSVIGIHLIGSTATLNVVNNQIILSPAASGSAAFTGIYDGSPSGSGVNVFYNTVVIGGTESGTRSSWASYRWSPTTHTARDNIFLNLRTGGSGSHFAAGSETTATGGAYTSSNNVYAGTGATAVNFMYFGNTTTPMDFATWQSTTGDTASQAGVAGSGSFTTAMFANAAAGDLHLVPGGNSMVNATGTPIAGVTIDYDGDPRSATTPTIGSDEAVPAPDIAVMQTAAVIDGVSSVDFGTVTVGSSSVAKTFTITNPGTGDLTGLAVSGGTGEFVVSALSGTSVPATGGNVTFTVSFTPSATGVRTAAIHIASNVSGAKNPFDIALTGTRLTILENWRQTFYGTTSNTGNAADNADPYLTGVPNLAVFALLGPNQDPAKVATGLLPQPLMSGGNYGFTFTEPAGVSGVTYGAEWRADLLSGVWATMTDTGTGTTHTFSSPVGSRPPIFMRLRVSTPP